MTSKEIVEYYNDTANREIRRDLIFATGRIDGGGVAIDCGCGAGADIEFLRESGFTVFAFDVEDESVMRCRDRFKNDENVSISQDSFDSYIYPRSSLVVADASLFFCSRSEFDRVLEKIYNSLRSGGVFFGSFLGPNDTMASADYDKDAYWPDVLVFTENDLRLKLDKFEILKFSEHNSSSEIQSGKPHRWHVFSVVAQKLNKGVA